MRVEILNVIKAVLALDNSIEPAERKRLIGVLTAPAEPEAPAVEKKGPPEAYMSPEQAAEYLGLNKRTLGRYAKAGRIVPYRLNTRVLRYRGSDLGTFVGTPCKP